MRKLRAITALWALIAYREYISQRGARMEPPTVDQFLIKMAQTPVEKIDQAVKALKRDAEWWDVPLLCELAGARHG